MKVRSGVRIALPGATLDFNTYRIYQGDRVFSITSAEADLLAVLLETPNRLVTTRELVSRLFPKVSFSRGHSRIKFTVVMLRRKLGPARDRLATVFGRGLVFILDPKLAPSKLERPVPPQDSARSGVRRKAKRKSKAKSKSKAKLGSRAKAKKPKTKFKYKSRIKSRAKSGRRR